jgi:hypothetical protein
MPNRASELPCAQPTLVRNSQDHMFYSSSQDDSEFMPRPVERCLRTFPNHHHPHLQIHCYAAVPSPRRSSRTVALKVPIFLAMVLIQSAHHARLLKGFRVPECHKNPCTLHSLHTRAPYRCARQPVKACRIRTAAPCTASSPRCISTASPAPARTTSPAPARTTSPYSHACRCPQTPT